MSHTQETRVGLLRWGFADGVPHVGPHVLVHAMHTTKYSTADGPTWAAPYTLLLRLSHGLKHWQSRRYPGSECACSNCSAVTARHHQHRACPVFWTVIVPGSPRLRTPNASHETLVISASREAVAANKPATGHRLINSPPCQPCNFRLLCSLRSIFLSTWSHAAFVRSPLRYIAIRSWELRFWLENQGDGRRGEGHLFSRQRHVSGSRLHDFHTRGMWQVSPG